MNFAGQFQFALDALLFQQRVRLAGIENGQRRRCGQGFEKMQVVGAEQPIAAALVDQLNGADPFALYRERRAEDGFGRIAGLFVDPAEEVRVLRHVADDLAQVVLHGTPDDALVGCDHQAGNFRRSDAGMAAQIFSLLVEQEQGPALGIDRIRDMPDSLEQGRIQIARGGEILRHFGQQFQVGLEPAGILRGGIADVQGGRIRHAGTMPVFNHIGK